MLDPLQVEAGSIIQYEGNENYLIVRRDDEERILHLLSLNSKDYIKDSYILSFSSFRANAWSILKS